MYGCTTNTNTDILTPVMVYGILDTGDSGNILQCNETHRENHGMNHAQVLTSNIEPDISSRHSLDWSVQESILS